METGVVVRASIMFPARRLAVFYDEVYHSESLGASYCLLAMEHAATRVTALSTHVRGIALGDVVYLSVDYMTGLPRVSRIVTSKVSFGTTRLLYPRRAWAPTRPETCPPYNERAVVVGPWIDLGEVLNNAPGRFRLAVRVVHLDDHRLGPVYYVSPAQVVLPVPRERAPLRERADRLFEAHRVAAAGRFCAHILRQTSPDVLTVRTQRRPASDPDNPFLLVVIASSGDGKDDDAPRVTTVLAYDRALARYVPQALAAEAIVSAVRELVVEADFLRACGHTEATALASVPAALRPWLAVPLAHDDHGGDAQEQQQPLAVGTRTKWRRVKDPHVALRPAEERVPSLQQRCVETLLARWSDFDTRAHTMINTVLARLTGGGRLPPPRKRARLDDG